MIIFLFHILCKPGVLSFLAPLFLFEDDNFLLNLLCYDNFFCFIFCVMVIFLFHFLGKDNFFV
jgi:hypothetical protein